MNRSSVTPPKKRHKLNNPSLYETAMATPHSLKGYDHQFVDQPPDDLLCLICLSVARDPQQITCCGKVLCDTCLKEHKIYTNDCPVCRIPIESFRDARSKSVKIGILLSHHMLSLLQVIDTSSHLKLNATIRPMVVSGLENYAHWINIC